MNQNEPSQTVYSYDGYTSTHLSLRLLHNAIGYLLCTPADVVNGVVRRFDAGDNGDIAWK